MTTTLTVVIEGITCGVCGIPFGLEESHLRKLRQTGDNFYCPNGHIIGYGKGENQRLKDQLAREKHQAEQQQAWLRDDVEREQRARERAEHSLRTTKGVVTKIRKRIGAGVCPCCDRSFQNLQRHMKGQHPTWAPEAES